MSGQLQGKVAIVTGGARGIGRVAALQFAREGASVVVSTGRDFKGGEETVRLVKEQGGKAIFVPCEITDEAAVQAMIKAAVDTYGRIDCAFNNAAAGHGQMLCADIPADDWRRAIDVALTGSWLCMKHEIQQFLAQGSGGSIINVTSTVGIHGFPYSAGYGAAKAGLIHLTKTAAKEYARQQIRVNAISPGPIATEMLTSAAAANPELLDQVAGMVPLGRVGQPEEVVDLAIFLSSDKAAFITGAMYTVDGGQTA
jgi:NAD(P)-dependent dehydrogenase (short-subunit alcohol dehydrogenase family)